MDAAAAGKLLGVDPDATSEREIRAAFRQLSRQCHPDRVPDRREEFEQLEKARDVLITDQWLRWGFDAKNEFKRMRADDAAHGSVSRVAEAIGNGDGTFRVRVSDDPDGFPSLLKVKVSVKPGDVAAFHTLIGLHACDECNSTGFNTADLAKQPQCPSCDGSGETIVACSAGSSGRAPTSADGHGAEVISMKCRDCLGKGRVLGCVAICRECAGKTIRIKEHRIRLDVPFGVMDGEVLRRMEEDEARALGQPDDVDGVAFIAVLSQTQR